jgi:hypothetical protein
MTSDWKVERVDGAIDDVGSAHGETSLTTDDNGALWVRHEDSTVVAVYAPGQWVRVVWSKAGEQ